MTTSLLLVLSLLGGVAQGPAVRFEFRQLSLQAPDGRTIRYGLAIPEGYDPSRPAPLVLALHPGGGGMAYYGDNFMREIFLPGLRELHPIMVAPDVSGRSWSDPGAERALMVLMNKILDDYSIDRHRILVVGFSIGGTGTWFMSSRHSDLFTAAIVMAGRTDEPNESLAKIPTYVIHSRDDRVVPFDQAETRAAALEKMGRAIKFEPLQGLGHFEMPAYIPALERAGRWVAERWAK